MHGRVFCCGPAWFSAAAWPAWARAVQPAPGCPAAPPESARNTAAPGGQLRARRFGLALLLGVFAADDLPKRTDFLYLGHQQANGGDTQHHGAYQHHDADGVAEHIAAQQQPRAHAQKAAQRSYREHRRGDFSSQFSSCHIIAPLIERSSPHRGRERFILCRKCGRPHRRDPARCSRSRSAFHPSRPHRCPRRDAPPAGAACLRAQR